MSPDQQGKIGCVTRFARYALVVPALVLALGACGTSPEAAFVEQARSIAPGIVGDDERLVSRAENTCSTLTDGRPREQAIEVAVQRFSSGSREVSSPEAEQLVAAAEATVCADQNG